MSKYLMCLIVLIVLLTACAGRYYKVKDDMVHFYLELSEAENVLFLSSLDGYESHKVKKNRDETWEIAVPADTEFRYFFMVDGKHFLPVCGLREIDDFGSANCVFTAEI